jgi:hypothetical protein
MLLRRHPWRLVPALIALFALFPALLPAQSAPPQLTQTKPQPTSTISGTLVDPSGAVIPGATVTVTPSASGGAPVTATSDGQGNFVISGLVPGTCSVQASSPGFRTARKPGIVLQAGKSQRLTLTRPF